MRWSMDWFKGNLCQVLSSSNILTRHLSGNRLWALHSKCDIWKKCLHLIAFMSVDILKCLIWNKNISKKKKCMSNVYHKHFLSLPSIRNNIMMKSMCFSWHKREDWCSVVAYMHGLTSLIDYFFDISFILT